MKKLRHWYATEFSVEKSHTVIQRSKALLAIAAFAIAVGAAVAGIVPLVVAIAAVVAVYALSERLLAALRSSAHGIELSYFDRTTAFAAEGASEAILLLQANCL